IVVGLVGGAALVLGCQSEPERQPAGDAGGGKADCADADRCAGGGGLVPLCEDGEDVGCLRHGITPEEWDKTKPEFINPGWTDEERQRWNHQDQGTKILPLSWILALEPVGILDGGPLLSDENLLAYGMLPDHDTRSNAYQLPVGFTTFGDFDLEGGVEDTTFGYTCAGCHTQLMNVEVDGKVQYHQIAGGSGLQDFGEWNKDMVVALVATRDTIFRRRRFIERVRAFQTAIYGEALAEEDIEKALNKYSYFGFLKEKSDISSEFEATRHGPGRLDALGRGFTTLHFDYLKDFVGEDGFTEDDLRSNLGPIDGMVGMPTVYDGPKWDWAEYGHSIRQAFARNTSEAVAVNSQTNLETLEGDINAEGLFFIEQRLRKLQAPTYPGEIDEDKRKLGRALFWGEEVEGIENVQDVYCARCHAPRENYDGREWKLNTIALGVIGTDPNTLTNFATREVTLPEPVWKTMFTGRVVGALNGLLGLDLDPDRPERVIAGLALFGLVDGLGIKLFGEQGWDWKSVSDRCRDPKTWDDGGECEATLGRLALYRVDIPRSGPRSDEERGALDPMKYLPAEGYDGADPRCDGVAADQRQSCLEEINWLAYRARPLNGMWAAAPFLHNNSVPNLCALLGDPNDRPDTFYVGNIDFDAECLGYPYEKNGALGFGLVGGIPQMPDGSTDSFKFDTGLPGNHADGHEFSAEYDPEVGPRDGVIGRALTDEEISALVEYVKSLPPLPPGPDGKAYSADYADSRYDELK
ncbi:MAG: di-heme-cytochrome C peroxidase, partial [Myxococcota bacterium]